MILNENQQNILIKLKEMIELNEKPTSKFVMDVCAAFGGHILTSLRGMGGTRIVISHPTKDDMVLKIAFNKDGIEGNKDEYETYVNAPDDVKAFLGEVGDLLEESILLEMKSYESISDEEFEDYSHQLENILSKINFIYYQDSPYFHSFGLNEAGELVLIDYGETEKFNLR